MNYLAAYSREEYSRIDKLNSIVCLRTFWDEVRKLTCNLTSDRAVNSWQRLAEIRFSELKVQTLNRFSELRSYMTNEVGDSTMSLVDDYITGKGNLPSYELGSDQAEISMELREMYQDLKELSIL